MMINCAIFWIAAKLTERKIDNCAGKIAQNSFAHQLYSNCSNSYLSIQTKIVFTSSFAIWGMGRNPFKSPLLPFHILSFTFFLFFTLIGHFLHLVNLKNTANNKRIRTKSSYFGTCKGKPSSYALVLSKILFGPLIAASIVLMPTYYALGFGFCLCIINIIAEFSATYLLRPAKWFAAGSAIVYLLYHLSICLLALKVLNIQSQSICGFVSLGCLGMIVLLRVGEMLTVLVYEICKKKNN